MTRLVGARRALAMLVWLALPLASCGSTGRAATSAASTAPPGPDVAVQPWFLLRNAGWTLHDGADRIGAAAPLLLRLRGLWFAEFTGYLTPNVSANAVVMLHDNGEEQSASEFAKTVMDDPSGVYVRAASVGATPAVIVESPNKDGSYAGAWVVWDAGPGYLVSLSCTQEVDLSACEALAGSVAPVSKAEWWAAVDAAHLGK